jgi:hypothetical protein
MRLLACLPCPTNILQVACAWGRITGDSRGGGRHLEASRSLHPWDLDNSRDPWRFSASQGSANFRGHGEEWSHQQQIRPFLY